MSSHRGWNTRGPGHLLHIIRSGTAWTKMELVRETALSRTTVVERLDALEDAGYIIANATSTLTGGRPAETFSFHREGGRVLVADIGGSHTRIGVADLSGELLAQSEFDLDTAAGPDAVLGRVADALAALVDSLPGPRRVRAIGVGVPGPVDTATGRISRPRSLPGWENALVPTHFIRVFDNVPVLVDKDANIMARGELHAAAENVRDVVVLKAGMGIGCGIVVDGRVLGGADGAAGDIAHLPLGGDEPCACGQIGCVEARAGGRAIAARLRAEGRQAHTSRDIVHLIRSGDPLAVSLVRQAGRDLGRVLSLTNAVAAPRVIIVGGNLAEAPEPLLAGIREVIYTDSDPRATSTLQVLASTVGARAGLSGAAQLALDAILAPATVDAAIAAGSRWS